MVTCKHTKEMRNNETIHLLQGYLLAWRQAMGIRCSGSWLDRFCIFTQCSKSRERLEMIILTFETWEEYDEAIASIATAYLPEAE